jgi:hypothetical protein
VRHAGATSRRVEWVIVILCIISFGDEIAMQLSYRRGPGGLFHCEEASWLIGDCLAYRATVRGLVDLRTLDQAIVAVDWQRYLPGSRVTVPIQYSTVSLTKDGRLVPKHPVAFAAALAPFYLALREWGLLLFNVLQCTALVVLCHRLALLWFEPAFSALAAFGVLAEGVVTRYSYNVSPDVFGAVLVLGGAVALWSPARSRPALVAGGLLLGGSLWMRPLNAIAAVVLVPLFVKSLRYPSARRELAWAVAAYAAAVALYLGLNLSWFGSPFVTPYDRVLVLTNGVRSVASHRNHMGRPFLASLPVTLFDRQHGLLITAPHVLALAVAAPTLARGSFSKTLALLALTIIPVLSIVPYEFWDASSHANRFFLLPAAASSVSLSCLGRLIVTQSKAPQPPRRAA